MQLQPADRNSPKGWCWSTGACKAALQAGPTGLHACKKRYSVTLVKQPVVSADEAPQIRAKRENILAAAAKAGIEGDTALGRAFGVSRVTAWRVLRRDFPASAEFIAGVLAKFPASEFEDLFELDLPTAPRSPDVPR